MPPSNICHHMTSFKSINSTPTLQQQNMHYISSTLRRKNNSNMHTQGPIQGISRNRKQTWQYAMLVMLIHSSLSSQSSSWLSPWPLQRTGIWEFALCSLCGFILANRYCPRKSKNSDLLQCFRPTRLEPDVPIFLQWQYNNPKSLYLAGRQLKPQIG